MADGLAGRHTRRDQCRDRHCPFVELIRAVIGPATAYSVDVLSLTRHAAHQVDQILKGAAAAETPFFQAANYHLSINRKAAKSLGLDIPSTLLARADEVIE